MHISHNLKTRHSVFVHIVLKTVQTGIDIFRNYRKEKIDKILKISLKLGVFVRLDVPSKIQMGCHQASENWDTYTNLSSLYVIRTVFLLIVHRHSFFPLVQPHAQVWQTAATANRIFWRFDVSCKVRMHASRHLKFGQRRQLFACFNQEQSNNVPFTGDGFFWFAKAQFSIFPERVHSKYANYLNI